MSPKKLPKKLLHRALSVLNPFDKIKFLIEEIVSFKTVKFILWFLLFLLIAPGLFFIMERPQIQKNINYGVNFSNKYANELGMDWKDTYITILDDLKVKNIRVVAYWDDIEKTYNNYDFSDIEWQLQEADKRNVNVILAIGRKVPRYPECFEPEWWKKIPDEEERNQVLYKYLKTAYYKLNHHPSIKMWQVENEPFFPFGTCLPIKKAVVNKEVDLIRELDQSKRPILIQDSGEGGFWFPSYNMGDYLGISMYRKIWYNFWGIFFGRFIYFEYPLAHWTYKIKAALVGVPYQKIIVTELQAEPWGPGPNHLLSPEEADKTMSRTDFMSTVSYAQKAGFKDLYFWGAEWWLFQRNRLGNPYYWDTAKALFN